jgi:hypothetical protein
VYLSYTLVSSGIRVAQIYTLVSSGIRVAQRYTLVSSGIRVAQSSVFCVPELHSGFQ